MSEADSISWRPVADFSAAQAAEAMQHCFEDYVVPMRTTPEGWERRFRGEHLDRFASRIYERGRMPVAVLFITRRGWTSRVGGMAVARSVRGTGLGRRVMRDAVADARARGDRTLMLEVIEQNTPAVRLYTSVGFRVARRLVGYRRTPGAGEGDAADPVREMDPADLARIVHAEGEPDLPWMMAPETLAAATYPARAFALGEHAYALVGNVEAPTLALMSLVVPRAHRRRGWGRRMLRALAAQFPGTPWQVVAIHPEDLAPEFFARTGWTRDDISQFEMRMEFGSGEPLDASDAVAT